MKEVIKYLFNINVLDAQIIEKTELLNILSKSINEDGWMNIDKEIKIELDCLLQSIFQHHSVAKITSMGSPFLWFSIYQFILSQSTHQNKKHNDEVISIIANLFDSYYTLLPNFTKIKLKSSNYEKILLPNLGINIVLQQENSALEKISNESMKIFSDNLQWEIIPINFKIKGRCKVILENLHNNMQFKHFKGSEYVGNMSDSTSDKFDMAIQSALQFIHSIDQNLFEDITHIIEFILPMQTKNDMIHRSSSWGELIGVIALSYSPQKLVVVEALIHEYYHNQLYLLMKHKKLIIDNQNKKFYSPWRDDPRPMFGLLHAIFVCVGIIKFYSLSLQKDINSEYKEWAENRLVSLCHQLNIAFHQIEIKEFTFDGILFLSEIRDIFINVYCKHKIKYTSVPQNIIEHLENWKKINKDSLDCCAKTPTYFLIDNNEATIKANDILNSKNWQSKKEIFKNDGVFYWPQLLNKNWLDIICSAMENRCNILEFDDKHYQQLGRYKNSDSINDVLLWRDDIDFRSLIFDSHLSEFVANILDSKVIRILWDNMIIKFPKGETETAWHRDFPFPFFNVNGTIMCRTWIAFDRVTQESGALQFAKGSHKIDKCHVKNNKKDIITFELDPGDCVFFHPNILHYTEANKSSLNRRAFTILWIGDDVTHIAYDSSNKGNKLIYENKYQPIQGHIAPLVWSDEKI